MWCPLWGQSSKQLRWEKEIKQPHTWTRVQLHKKHMGTECTCKGAALWAGLVSLLTGKLDHIVYIPSVLIWHFYGQTRQQPELKCYFPILLPLLWFSLCSLPISHLLSAVWQSLHLLPPSHRCSGIPFSLGCCRWGYPAGPSHRRRAPGQTRRTLLSFPQRCAPLCCWPVLLLHQTDRYPHYGPLWHATLLRGKRGRRAKKIREGGSVIAEISSLKAS